MNDELPMNSELSAKIDLEAIRGYNTRWYEHMIYILRNSDLLDVYYADYPMYAITINRWRDEFIQIIEFPKHDGSGCPNPGKPSDWADRDVFIMNILGEEFKALKRMMRNPTKKKRTKRIMDEPAEESWEDMLRRIGAVDGTGDVQ